MRAFWFTFSLNLDHSVFMIVSCRPRLNIWSLFWGKIFRRYVFACTFALPFCSLCHMEECMDFCQLPWWLIIFLQIWDTVSKPQAHKDTPLSEFFNARFPSLSLSGCTSFLSDLNILWACRWRSLLYLAMKRRKSSLKSRWILPYIVLIMELHKFFCLPLL